MKITSLFENDDDVGRLQSHYSDFHKDLHGFRPRHHSQDEWNDPAFLQQQIDLLHATMDKMKKTPEGRKALEDEGWIFDKEQGVDEIAGAFPSPSTREKWAKDAAASNAAEAKRQEALKAQQLQKNTAEVEKQQKINHHSLDGVAVPSNEAYENPDEYHVLRHQTKDDIDREITMPAAWTKLKEFDSYQEAQNAYKEMKDKFPNQKFTVTSHSKKRREEFRKQHGIYEAKGPCWKKYKQLGMKMKNGKKVPNCVPKE